MHKQRLERYSLVGSEADRAIEAGLTDATWFRSEIPRKRMKELMCRSDAPGIRDALIWVGGMGASGALGVLLWPHWPAILLFLIYGTLYSGSDAWTHETGHGTAYRTRWINDLIYRVTSFMQLKDPAVARWSHTRHHTDTLILGRDPEIVVMRPARLARILANFFGLVEVPIALLNMAVHSTGRLLAEERTFIPESERPGVYWRARLSLIVYAGVIAGSVVSGSPLPLLLVLGPKVYGASYRQLLMLTQHAGMGENVLDHRLNSRTIHMCVINRFLYRNMNYHVEHHMFPMVPYHRLRELHDEVKHDLAPAYPSLWSAYKEIVPAVIRQLKDQTYYVHRELLPGAPPLPAGVDGRALGTAGV